MQAGRHSFYIEAVIEYCDRNRIDQDMVTRKPDHKLSKDELELIAAIYNNPKSACTLQAIVDNIDAFMLKVKMGANPDTIWYMCNPWEPKDCCIGYTPIEQREIA